MVRNSEVLTDVNPGKPIRFPVEEKGRFEPLSLESWEGKFLVAPIGFYGLDPATDEAQKQEPNPAEPQKQTSVPANEQSSQITLAADLAAEMHAVFCPIHLVYESAPDFTPGWVRKMSNKTKTADSTELR